MCSSATRARIDHRGLAAMAESRAQRELVLNDQNPDPKLQVSPGPILG